MYPHQQTRAPAQWDQPGFALSADRHLEALAGLRGSTRLSGAVSGEGIWVRWDSLSPDEAQRLRSIPKVEFFKPAPDALRRWGERLPSRELGKLDWQPLSSLLAVKLPARGFAAAVPSAVPLNLVRATSIQPVTALTTETRRPSAALGLAFIGTEG